VFDAPAGDAASCTSGLMTSMMVEGEAELSLGENTATVLFVVLAAVGRVSGSPISRVGWPNEDDGDYYTDDFARNKMLLLAAAAYSDQPDDCLGRHFGNASLYERVSTQCEHTSPHECAGYTALSHDDRAIILAFRGTNSFLQLCKEVDFTVLRTKKDAPLGGKVGSYFHAVFVALWESGIGANVDRLMSEYPNYQIWVTGHSLGGSIASLIATHILNEYNLPEERIRLVTFGQPRTGDTDYADAHNLRFPHSYRVVNKRDMIPHVPPVKFEDYYHHENEVWYPSGMAPNADFVVCKEGESKDCSDSQWFDVSVYDHVFYFGKYVSTYGRDGCVEKHHDYSKLKESELKL